MGTRPTTGMGTRRTLLACLMFSGASALVYQVLWTRFLGFAFGTTTEAVGTVLAIFFGGLAAGNWLVARRLWRVSRPLRLYALLELGIGAFALLTLPLLLELPAIFTRLGAGHGPALLATIRVGIATLLLAPPAIAMGATLPAVVRGLVDRDETLGRRTAQLYAANTLGAVLGAYTSGFWLVPALGLVRSVIAAAVLNVAVAAVVFARARVLSVPASPAAPERAGGEDESTGPRRVFLFFFGVSGFVAIGYEIVWSRVFAIVMEGTLYGFSAVLSAYLLGLALGSLWISRRVDGIRNLPRAFALLHVGIAVLVALGMTLVADLPHWHHRLTAAWPGGSGLHSLFLVAAPIVLAPTALFGAAFPILIRLYSPRASRAAEGVGIATAVNTAGSIAASLSVGFWMIPTLGLDTTLTALVALELGVALLVMVGFQTGRESRRLAGVRRERAGGFATAALALIALGLSANGVRVEKAVAGRWVFEPDLASYREALDRVASQTALVVEGKTSIVTVHHSPEGWALKTNGMPEAGFLYAPPHRGIANVLLGVLPYLCAEQPERGLVIGIGGGATLDALRATGLGSIEVVELEAGVVEALPLLYRGREDPLADPRVRVRINDGRNELLLARAEGRSWDVIASQPSHPWLMGAANLFTEEFFALVRDNLSEGGTFGAWINGTHTDTESLLAIMTSFERVFPGGLLLSAASTANPTKSLLLLGGRSPVVWDLARMRERLAEPALAAALALHDVRRVEDLLARAEAPLAALAALDPDAANTDDNAFVETRLSRRFDWADVDFGKIEERLPRNAPVLPPLRGELDAVALLDSVAAAAGPDGTPVYRRKLDRLLAQLGAAVEPVLRETLDAELTLRAGEPADPAVSRLQSLARHHPTRAEPLRALGRHWARRGGDLAAAAAAFEEAWRRSGESSDAYDAARAWHSLDREASWGWRDRIPQAESDRFPRIAVYDAERALAQGADRGALERHERAVRAYRDTREGRKYARIDRVLADLATALGRDREARAYADADRRRRAARAGELVRLAETALGEGRLSDAQGALDGAAGLLPGDFAVLRLQVQLARARRDAPATAAALGEIQHWARTLERGVAAENRVRAELGLPLRPPRPAPTGLVAGQPPGG